MLVVKHHVVTKLPILEIENDIVIFEQGDQDSTMYFVLEGSVMLYVQKNESEQEIAQIKKNEFFGGSELYTQTARTVCAKTTSHSRIIAIKTTAEFERFVTENRFLSGKVMEDMSKKLAETNATLATKRLNSTAPQSTVALEVVKENPNGKGGGVRHITRH
jgi:CRP/FNR family transcriptional regulator, cyclic AMP receptor protein